MIYASVLHLGVTHKGNALTPSLSHYLAQVESSPIDGLDIRLDGQSMRDAKLIKLQKRRDMRIVISRYSSKIFEASE